MPEQEADQADEPTAEADDSAAAADAGDDAGTEESSMAGAVDDRASQLTGSEGAAQADTGDADNRGAVADAEAHLDDANLDQDRETLKQLQKDM